MATHSDTMDTSVLSNDHWIMYMAVGMGGITNLLTRYGMSFIIE